MTIMFDLDGTLLPFEQDEFVKQYFGGLCKKLAPYGYEADAVVKYVWKGTEAMVRNDGSRANSEAFWEVFRAAFPDKPDAREFCDEFYTKEFDAVRTCLRYVPDRKPLLERIKAAGHETVLATNPLFPLCAVETRLGWVGLSPRDFAYITHYDNNTYCKPNPKYYEEVLEKLGKKPEECFMVGNSVPEDMQAAKAAGIDGFLVTEFAENPKGVDLAEFRTGTLEEAAEYILRLV